MKYIIAFIFLCLGTIGYANIAAKKGIIQARQPDGTVISIRMIGDARNKTIHSADGYLLTTDEAGYYVFANKDAKGMPVPSGVHYQNPEHRSPADNNIIKVFDTNGLDISYAPVEESRNVPGTKGPGLGKSKFPGIGNHRAVVILVEFSDIDFTIENPHDFYTRLLNEEGFSDYGATGSVRDYFVSNSCGKFQPQFDVYGPVKLDKPHYYYGMNSPLGGGDMNPYDMVVEACELLDNEIDFSQYDCNEDGFIDNIYFYYAGYGEADGGGANTIWPHSWDITKVSWYPFRFDGVRLDHYACSNELKFENDEPDGIGTFCHEFCHVLGFPDLYPTGYSSAFTPYSWNILDMGNYNNDSHTPANMSAYERYALDWLEPELLTGGEKTLVNLADSNHAFLVKTENDDEYFLLENRQQKGFDEYLPGHGMLVWHIDFIAQKWDNNTVNNIAYHQCVDLIEADDVQTRETDDGDPFPGAMNVTEFSPSTSPAFISWNNTPLPFCIYDIRESEEGVVTFSVDAADAGVEKINNKLGVLIIGNEVILQSTDVRVYNLAGYVMKRQKSDRLILPKGVYMARDSKNSIKFVIE